MALSTVSPTSNDFASLIRRILVALPQPEASALAAARIKVATVDLHSVIVPRRPDLLAPIQGRAFFRILKATLAPDAHVLGALVPPYVRDNPVPLRSNQVALTMHTGSTGLLESFASLVTVTFEILGDDIAVIERRVDFQQQPLKLAA